MKNKIYIITIHEDREYQVKVEAKNQEQALEDVRSGNVDWGDDELVWNEVQDITIK